ncbi:putative leucine-rich repeat protein [Tanacetum coccineum]
MAVSEREEEEDCKEQQSAYYGKEGLKKLKSVGLGPDPNPLDYSYIFRLIKEKWMITAYSLLGVVMEAQMIAAYGKIATDFNPLLKKKRNTNRLKEQTLTPSVLVGENFVGTESDYKGKETLDVDKETWNKRKERTLRLVIKRILVNLVCIFDPGNHHINLSKIGNFKNLRSLYLAGNTLKEDLPRIFQRLEPARKSIEVLELSYNKISGSLPDFTTFTALKELHLKGNEMQGTFSEKFEKISNIFILDLADNQICGLLPDLSTLSSLRELYFERNHLEGALAERIMSLSELQFLGVFSNLLHGTMTETHLKNLSQLVYLDLSHNSLVIKLGSHNPAGHSAIGNLS